MNCFQKWPKLRTEQNGRFMEWPRKNGRYHFKWPVINSKFWSGSKIFRPAILTAIGFIWFLTRFDPFSLIVWPALLYIYVIFVWRKLVLNLVFSSDRKKIFQRLLQIFMYQKAWNFRAHLYAKWKLQNLKRSKGLKCLKGRVYFYIKQFVTP